MKYGWLHGTFCRNVGRPRLRWIDVREDLRRMGVNELEDRCTQKR
jgi:hypothetical protein